MERELPWLQTRQLLLPGFYVHQRTSGVDLLSLLDRQNNRLRQSMAYGIKLCRIQNPTSPFSSRLFFKTSSLGGPVSSSLKLLK